MYDSDNDFISVNLLALFVQKFLHVHLAIEYLLVFSHIGYVVVIFIYICFKTECPG